MRVKYSEILFFLGMIAIMFGNLFMVTAYPFVYPGVAIILKLVRYLGYMIIILKILYEVHLKTYLNKNTENLQRR